MATTATFSEFVSEAEAGVVEEPPVPVGGEAAPTGEVAAVRERVDHDEEDRQEHEHVDDHGPDPEPEGERIEPPARRGAAAEVRTWASVAGSVAVVT